MADEEIEETNSHINNIRNLVNNAHSNIEQMDHNISEILLQKKQYLGGIDWKETESAHNKRVVQNLRMLAESEKNLLVLAESSFPKIATRLRQEEPWLECIEQKGYPTTGNARELIDLFRNLEILLLAVTDYLTHTKGRVVAEQYALRTANIGEALQKYQTIIRAQDHEASELFRKIVERIANFNKIRLKHGFGMLEPLITMLKHRLPKLANMIYKLTGKLTTEEYSLS
ncbi:hypothetical protein JW868_02805 [Candidatus Woesearchaeota archaeon]|nr:hypothetical protein [Candidatus Woesearchaeota archaeon]